MNRSGVRAEDLCAERMRRAGLRILARNWRCRLGEIDLIADEAGVTVFADLDADGVLDAGARGT